MSNTQENIIKLIEMMELMNDKIDKLDEKINIIMENNIVIETNCAKMNEHINFVEETYAVTRAPLNFIKNKIEYMMGNSQVDNLPIC